MIPVLPPIGALFSLLPREIPQEAEDVLEEEEKEEDEKKHG